MQKEEFEALANVKVLSDDYDIIETVYMNHPAIDNVRGKEKIAALYKIGGMTLMIDMAKRAEFCRKADLKIADIKFRINELEREIINLEDRKTGFYDENEFEKGGK